MGSSKKLYALNLPLIVGGGVVLLTVGAVIFALARVDVHVIDRSGQHIECQMPTPLIGAGELNMFNTLHFRNDTGKAWRITDVVTSCGCTTADFPVDAVPENGLFDVSLKVAFGRGGGDRMVKCLFRTDAGITWSTSFRAIALPAIQLDYSAQSIWAGEFVLGDAGPWNGSATFIHNSVGRSPCDLKAGHPQAELSAASVTEIPISSCPSAIRTLAADLVHKRAYRLNFSIKAQGASGIGRSVITLNRDDGSRQGRQGVALIPVTWGVTHPCVIAPQQIVVRSDAGKDDLPAVEIRSKLNRPFSIVDVAFSNDDFCVDRLLPADDRTRWTLRLRSMGANKPAEGEKLSRAVILIEGFEAHPLILAIVRM